MNVFGIGLPELVMLVLLGTLLFGPEKIPEYSRKAARVVYFLRNIANNAQEQLRSELGPEYADLELKDLHPKALVQKHVLDAIQGDLDEIKADLANVKESVDGELAEARALGDDLRSSYESPLGSDEAEHIPFDPEAT